MDNIHRCNSLKYELFDSSTMKLKHFKENILQEISTKWDSTFNDPIMGAVPAANMAGFRKSKNRSVYGQPQIEKPTTTNTNQSSNATTNMQHSNHWKSLDSLEYCESNQSFGSNSTSFSDLRTLDCQNKTQDLIVSDLGTSVESFDTNEQEPTATTTAFKRCPSVNSTSSGCSVTETREDVAREAKQFMKIFVERIFDNSTSITLEEKAKFGYYSRVEAGRLWFARYINKKRNENKCVSESTFYSLAQYFAIVLFECAESDDFTPAKVLMNMCFTYYHHQQPTIQQRIGSAGQPSSSWSRQNSLENTGANSATSSSNTGAKQYLYTILRDQPIWKLIRFWNAAFFDAIQCERDNFYDNNKNSNNHNNNNMLHNINDPINQQQQRFYDWQFHANLTFGQLGTFTYNMYSFGLSKQFCLDFLRKQSTIANLTPEQFQLLSDNIETMFQRQQNMQNQR